VLQVQQDLQTATLDVNSNPVKKKSRLSESRIEAEIAVPQLHRANSVDSIDANMEKGNMEDHRKVSLLLPGHK